LQREAINAQLKRRRRRQRWQINDAESPPEMQD